MSIAGQDSAMVRKWNDEGAAADNIGWQSEINFRLLRYAEVLLLYAETLNELGQTASAYPYIQQVRDRVGLPELSPGMTQDEMRMAIAHERQLEFAMESKRYIDIRRWGWLADTEKLDMLKANDPEYETFVTGREYFPIPSTAISLNPNLEQDPGWITE